jgi:Fic family protein
MVMLYDSVHQFEPLLPSDAAQSPLLSQAHDLARSALLLAGSAVPGELRCLLRSMNSYYSNRIEGQHTRPFEIEQALRRDFSANRELAARQRLAVAHIETEAVEQFAVDVRLPTEDLNPDAGPVIAPGILRTREVSVGHHIAPAWQAVPTFLTRWAEVYGNTRRGEAALLALAAAHQRLGWVHPFVDGNGRVMRLHTHTLLAALGYTGGLWSPLRGFARSSPDMNTTWS